MNTQSTTAAAPNKSRVNSEQGMMILLAVIVAIAVLRVLLGGRCWPRGPWRYRTANR